MNKLLPTIADMPQEDREIVDFFLSDLAQLAREMRIPKIRDAEAKGKTCEKCGKPAGYKTGQVHFLCKEDWISLMQFLSGHPDASYLGKYGKNWWDSLYQIWLKDNP